MELALPWEAQARANRKSDRRFAGKVLDVGKSRAPGSLPFLDQELGVGFAFRQEEIAVQTLEIAIDLLAVDRAFYRVDGGGMARRDELRSAGAVNPRARTPAAVPVRMTSSSMLTTR